MSLLRLDNLSKFYKSGDGVSVGIQRVSVSFDYGEFVGITGESGSGKTTLVNVLSGLDKYEDGELYINNEETSHFTTKEWEKYRSSHVGFVFQNYNIIDSYTVYQNVLLALEVENYPLKERRKRALELIDRVGLTSHKNHRAAKLSGGEKQRTVIARALAKNSPIIIADEPTGNLDSDSSKKIIDLLYEISKDKLVIVVTHDFDQIKEYATRKIKMHDGEIIEDKILKKPSRTDDEFKFETTSMKFKSLFRIAFRNILAMPKRFVFFIVLQLLIILLFTYVYANMMTQARSEFFDFSSMLSSSGLFGIYDDHTPSNRMFIVNKDFTPLTSSDYSKIESYGIEDSYIYKDITMMDKYVNLSLEYQIDGEIRGLFDFMTSSTHAIPSSYVSNVGNLNNNEVILSNSFDELKVGDEITINYVEQITEVIDDFEINDELIWWEGSNYGGTLSYTITVTFNNDQKEVIKLHSYSIEYYHNFDLNDIKDIKIERLGSFPRQDTFEVKGIFNDNFSNTIYLPHKLLDTNEYGNVFTIQSKTESIARRVFNNINKNEYRVIYPTLNEGPLGSVFGPINFLLSLVYYAIIVGMGIFLYFILFLVLRNVMESRRKDFAIYRSIGAHQSNLGWLVLIEQFILTTISFFLSLMFYSIFSRYDYNLYLTLSNVTKLDYLIIFLTLTYLSSWLARRFNKKTFNLSIIENLTESKELEL